MNELDHISHAAVHDQLVEPAATDHFSPCGGTFEQGSSKISKGHASHSSVLFSFVADPKRWISHYPLPFICIISKSEVTWPVTGSWLKLIHAQNIRMSGFHRSNNLKLREMHTSSSLCQSSRPLIRFSLKLLLGICHTICLTYFAHVTASWYVFRSDQIIIYTTTTTWI